MASIRKAKKAIKREIRRIDEAIIELSKYEGTAYALWDLFLYRGCLQRQIKSLGKAKRDPWKGDGRKPISFSELEQRNLLYLIKGIKWVTKPNLPTPT